MKHKVEEHFSCLHTGVPQHGLGQRGFGLISRKLVERGSVLSSSTELCV